MLLGINSFKLGCSSECSYPKNFLQLSLIGIFFKSYSSNEINDCIVIAEPLI